MSENRETNAPDQPDTPRPHSDNGAPQGQQPAFNIPGSLLILASACIGVHIWLTQFSTPFARDMFVFNYALVPLRFVDLPQALTDFGTLLTLLSHSFIHGSWLHLIFNLVWLIAFGAPLAYRLGPVRTFLFWALTAGVAAAFHMAIYWGDPIPLIGASGAVSGFLGASARFGFRRPRQAGTGFEQPLLPPIEALRQRGVLPFILLWMGLNFATGTGLLGGPSNIAWEAHIGGLAAGFFLIGLVDNRSYRVRQDH
ncbi:MAG: rhomboid family intramembrane serine protease [Pseudomonadota bacterium]